MLVLVCECVSIGRDDGDRLRVSCLVGRVLSVNPCSVSGHFASSVNCSHAGQQQSSFYPAPLAPDYIVLTWLQHDQSAPVADYKALFQTLVQGIKLSKKHRGNKSGQTWAEADDVKMKECLEICICM